MGLFEHFPYTNFHDLNLNWIIELINTWKTEYAAYQTDWQTLNDAFNDLKEYIENLDFTDEVSEKIDLMMSDGTMAALFKSLFNIVTPAMFGAAADGTTDDTQAFIDMISDAYEHGYLIAIGELPYKLTENIYTDESLVICDKGSYPDKPLIISKKLSASVLNGDIIKKLHISDLNAGGKWLNGSCYDTTRNQLVMAFNDDTNVSYLTALASDLETVTGNGTITGGYHLNSLTYNEKTDLIYAPGINAGEIAIINPGSLSLNGTATISGLASAIRSIAYDSANDLYYVSAGDKVYRCSSTFTIEEGTDIDCTVQNLADETAVPVNSISRQASIVINEQIFEIWHSGDKYYDGAVTSTRNVLKFWLTQFNYQTKDIKASYSFNSAVGYDEIESAFIMDGVLYLMSCQGTHDIFITKVSFPDVYTGISTVPVNTNINEGTDMNDLILPGKYSVISNTVAATLINSPFTKAFTLYVLSNARGQYLIQVFISITGEIVLRRFDGSSTTWKSGSKGTTSEGWHYDIKPDGSFDAWFIGTVDTTSETAVGSNYYSNKISIPLPSAISNINAYAFSGIAGSLCWLVNPGISGNNLQFYLMRSTSVTGLTGVSIRIVMHGTMTL